MYVIDASVHVADARPQDPNHAEARAFLDRVAEEGWPVVLPTIVLAEVAAAISRGMGVPDVARRAAAILWRQPHFRFLAVDDLLGDQAAEVAAEAQIRGCDAVYVALALLHGATLITLDREQQARVPDDMAARTPAQELAVLT
jgi:predicted nucleic acid-binding protein